MVAGTNPRLSPTGQISCSRDPASCGLRRSTVSGWRSPAHRCPCLKGCRSTRRDGVVCAGPRRLAVSMPRPAARSSCLLTGRASPRCCSTCRVCTTASPQPSPDGHRLVMAFSEQVASNPNIWTYDLERRLISRLTFGRSWDSRATLDARCANGSCSVPIARGGARNLFWTAADGSGVPEQLTRSLQPQNAEFMDEGRARASLHGDSTSPDIWTLQVDPASPPEPFLRTPYKEFAAAFSPDGRWLAYQSNDTERD